MADVVLQRKPFAFGIFFSVGKHQILSFHKSRVFYEKLMTDADILNVNRVKRFGGNGGLPISRVAPLYHLLPLSLVSSG